MSIVILIAPFAETAATAWTFIQKAGVSDAAPSRREQLTPQQVQQLMLKTWHQRHRAAATPSAPAVQAAQPAPPSVLDTIWTELATDLVLGNVDHAQFGWCQTLDEHTPAFWQRFDPEIRFVLVYEEPSSYVARVIAQDHAQAQDLQGTLQHWHAHHSLLLSSFYALGAYGVLVHASQMQIAAAYLGLAVPADTIQMVSPALPGNDVLAQLLLPLVASNAQVQALWQELQAAAQGPWQEPLPPLPAAHHALLQCLGQQQAHEQNKRQLQEAQEQGEHLLTQLHQVQEELESHFLKLQEESKAKAELQARLTAETQAKQAEATAKAVAQQQLQTLQKAQEHEQEQNKRQLQEAQEEGELLLTQLHQVQEELENYFLKYQEQRKQYQTVADFWRQHPPAEVWVDMRRTPDSQGWYETEADGRWSGPGTESALAFPPLGAGQYLVELQIADAMAPELVAGLQLSAQLEDGQALPVDLVHEFGPANQLYPMVSTGLLQLPNMQHGWQLCLALPSVISPAEHGGTDTRQLGLRLQGVRLSLQHADPTEIQPETLA